MNPEMMATVEFRKPEIYFRIQISDPPVDDINLFFQGVGV